MKIKISELIKKPSLNKKILKKALKDEIVCLNYMDKYPSRYFAYKMMLKYIYQIEDFQYIFNKEILDYELEVK